MFDESAGGGQARDDRRLSALRRGLTSTAQKLGFTDQQRVDAIMEGIEGKRLTYRSSH
jgi:hypothetical protein